MALTPAQQAARKHGLGASMAAAAIGLSKWKTPYRLYREMRGLDKPSDEELLHLEIGQNLEPLTLARFERKEKVKVIDRQLQIYDPQNPWRWVTLDGRSDRDGALVEAKSVGIADPREWGEEFEDNQVPMEYYMQGQHALACVPDAPYCWMPVIVLNRQFRIYRIQRSPETITLMTAQERAFLTMVENGTPPKPEDMEDIKLMYPSHHEGGRVEASPEIAAMVLEFKASKEQVKAAELQHEQWKLQIAAAMGASAELVYKGKLMVTYKKARDGVKLDVDRFRQENPALYEKYLIPVTGSRRMLTK